MLVKHIHTYALERLKFVTIALLIIGVIFVGLFSYHVTNKGAADSFKSEAQSLQMQVGQVKDKIQKSDAAIKEWNAKVRNKHEFRDGIQVDLSKVLISKLENLYRLRAMNITLTTPEVRADFADNKFSNVVYSGLTLVFLSYTDVDAYSFIQDLLKELPGYVQVKSVSFIGINEINEEVLASLGRGDKNDIVSIKVDLIWHDLIDKPEIAEKIKAKREEMIKEKGATPNNAAATASQPTTPSSTPKVQ